MSPAPTMDHDEREKLILDTAERLILHYGYDKTTMNDIAKEAGISKGAIYLHYSSKEAMFEAVILRDLNLYSDDALRWIEEDEDSWSFIKAYEYGIMALAKRKIMMALARSDERIFGSFLKRTQLDMMALKRGPNNDLIKKMQEVGAFRTDLDVNMIGFLMQAIGWGVTNAREFMEEDDIPTVEDIAMGLGKLLQNALIPPDGGNQEAGRKIFIAMGKQVRERMNKHFSQSDDIQDAD